MRFLCLRFVYSRLLYLILALITCGCVYWMGSQPPEKPAARQLNFEGVPMRASLDDLRRVEPGFEIANKSPDGHVQMLYGENLRPFGIQATDGSAALYNGRLAQVLIKFQASDAAGEYSALVRTFGPPSAEITPGQCAEDYVGCAAAWYLGPDSLTFNGPAGRWALVDTTMIEQVRASMG